MNVQRHLDRECNREFGPNHEHDERECAIVLRNMSSDFFPGADWTDSWEDNMNTSSHIGFSVFVE